MGLPAFVGVVSADDEGITTPEAERMGDWWSFQAK
jgi:hypothetical protein